MLVLFCHSARVLAWVAAAQLAQPLFLSLPPLPGLPASLRAPPALQLTVPVLAKRRPGVATQVGLRLAPSSYEAASSGERRTDRLRVPMPPQTRPAGPAPGKVLACWLRSRASETGRNGPR